MKFSAASANVVLLAIGFAWSQFVYPPTLKVPVTFYDFHADGSNPDFEPGLRACGAAKCISGADLHQNMAADTLDSQRKPLGGYGTYFSSNIKNWFRPWPRGDFTAPSYNSYGSLIEIVPVDHDTSCKDIVIPDTLNFTLVPNSPGSYRYSDSSFFRLDGRGFGNEPAGASHNYGYAMEMHWDFNYYKGMIFDFRGDDLWVFINGRLVVDLGGIHDPMNVSLNLDTVPGLIADERYRFDFFYAERHMTGSDIVVTTNIISVCPCLWVVRLEKSYGKDTVAFGDSVSLIADIMDDTGGLHHDMSALCDWALSPARTASSLRNAQGGSNMFYANTPGQTFAIVVKYNGPTDGIKALVQRTDQCTVYVKPGPVSNRPGPTFTDRAPGKEKSVPEYFNILGRKFRGVNLSRVDGILLERTIAPSGTTSVKKKFRGPDSRLRIQK
jgi:fibro-slime domain-containing protein